jgi:hypothetical protein
MYYIKYGSSSSLRSTTASGTQNPNSRGSPQTSTGLTIYTRLDKIATGSQLDVYLYIASVRRIKESTEECGT